MIVPRSLFQRISVATVCAQHAGSLLGSGIAQAMVRHLSDYRCVKGLFGC